MKFEELKQSRTYKAYTNVVMSLGVTWFFVVALFIFSIVSKEALAIFIAAILTFGLGGLIAHYYLILKKIKNTAKSFQACEGKVVNVENGMGRGFLKLVVIFKDMMGEDHRMPSHGIILQTVIQDYLEKEITVYYSPLWKEVLIKESPEELSSDVVEEEDPFRL